MNVTRFVSRLCAPALACAAFAAQAAAQGQPSGASVQKASAEAAAPRALWKDVRVEFEGNRLFTSERLRELTCECYGRDEPEFVPEKLDYCLRMSVLGFLRRSGHLQAQLGETRAERTGAGETLTVPVEEKELYRLGEVKIEGAEFFTPARLREMLPLKAGDVADADALGRWMSEHMRTAYADEGFIQYEYDLEPEFRLDAGAREGVADLKVTVNEGRRFKLRRLTFAGAGDVPEETLRGAALVREGEVFSARKLADGVQRLNQLGLFRALDADRDAEFSPDEETAELDIVIRVKSSSPGHEAEATQSTRPDAPAAEVRPGKPSLKRRGPQTRED